MAVRKEMRDGRAVERRASGNKKNNELSYTGPKVRDAASSCQDEPLIRRRPPRKRKGPPLTCRKTTRPLIGVLMDVLHFDRTGSPGLY